MTFEDIKLANKSIKPTDVRGKDYAEVNQRIKAFRQCCPGGSIKTFMMSNEGGVCVFRAEVYDGDGMHLGTGHAYEREGSTNINKTSYIENCETSAVGRALGMCGFGIDTSVASAEEVQTAILQQEEKPKCENCGDTIEETIGKNGKKYSAGTIIATSKKRFGKCYCAKCQSEFAKMNKEKENK